MSMTELFGSDEGSDVEESEDERTAVSTEPNVEIDASSDEPSDEDGEGEEEREEEDKDEREEEQEEDEGKNEENEEQVELEGVGEEEDDISDDGHVEQEGEQKRRKENKNSFDEDESSEENEDRGDDDVVGDNDDDDDDDDDNDDDDDDNEKEKEVEENEKSIENNKNVSSIDVFGELVSSEDDEDEDNKEPEVSEQTEEVTQQPTASDEDQEEEPEETQINIEIPFCKFRLGSEIAFVKLPNFLSVETKPFDATTYEDEFEEDEVMDDEGRSRLKLRVENTVRWRNVKDAEGNGIKESNARVVRWSDGTMSLLLGAEVFDIHKTKIDGEHNHLFVQQGTGLQAQAIFHDKLTFRPHSTNSQTHRKMTLSIADRVSKAGKIKILPVVGKDPESQKSKLIKEEEEKLREALRRENQQRRKRERSHVRSLTASYLEPDRYDDDEEALEQSLLDMKRQYKKGLAKGRLGDVYSDQESEEEGISGGLESDDDITENSGDKKSSLSENGSSRQRKHSFEEGVVRKKRKNVIAESDEDESD